MQTIYLIKGLYPTYTKNFYNSIGKKQITHFKNGQRTSIDISPKKISLVFFLRFYLLMFEREREQARGKGRGRGRAAREPDAGFHLTTLRSCGEHPVARPRCGKVKPLANSHMSQLGSRVSPPIQQVTAAQARLAYSLLGHSHPELSIQLLPDS